MPRGRCALRPGSSSASWTEEAALTPEPGPGIVAAAMSRPDVSNVPRTRRQVAADVGFGAAAALGGAVLILGARHSWRGPSDEVLPPAWVTTARVGVIVLAGFGVQLLLRVWRGAPVRFWTRVRALLVAVVVGWLAFLFTDQPFHVRRVAVAMGSAVAGFALLCLLARPLARLLKTHVWGAIDVVLTLACLTWIPPWSRAPRPTRGSCASRMCAPERCFDLRTRRATRGSSTWSTRSSASPAPCRSASSSSRMPSRWTTRCGVACALPPRTRSTSATCRSDCCGRTSMRRATTTWTCCRASGRCAQAPTESAICTSATTRTSTCAATCARPRRWPDRWRSGSGSRRRRSRKGGPSRSRSRRGRSPRRRESWPCGCRDSRP